MEKRNGIIITIVLLIAVVVAGAFMIKNKRANMDDQDTVGVNPNTSQTVCYAYDKSNGRGLNDRALLKMTTTNDGVISGEYWNFPAERDSRFGTFTNGRVLEQKLNGDNVVDTWWNAEGEGMVNVEQFRIAFNDTTAAALYGEMMDTEDGRYVYKNPDQLTKGFVMTREDCTSYDDRFIVDKYVRDNIMNLSLELPVLGGKWYATKVTVDPVAKTGTVRYEDGHVQKTADFEYTRNGNSVEILWAK